MIDTEGGLEGDGAVDVLVEAVEVGLDLGEGHEERARVCVGALEGGQREGLGVGAGALGDGEEVVEAVTGLEELRVEIEAEGLRVGWHDEFPELDWVVCAGQSAALDRGVAGTTRPGGADAERADARREPPPGRRGIRAERGQGSPTERIGRRSLALALYGDNEPVTWV